MKRCGSCGSLRAPFGVDMAARSCRHHLPMTVEEVNNGHWADTSSSMTVQEQKDALEQCDHFNVPEYL